MPHRVNCGDVRRIDQESTIAQEATVSGESMNRICRIVLNERQSAFVPESEVERRRGRLAGSLITVTETTRP
jgi:hypothetical protein